MRRCIIAALSTSWRYIFCETSRHSPGIVRRPVDAVEDMEQWIPEPQSWGITMSFGTFLNTPKEGLTFRSDDPKMSGIGMVRKLPA